MPDFQYIARDATGRQSAGVIAAPSSREAASMLAARALFPVSLAEDQGPKQSLWQRRISPQALATLYAQLAGLLRSGVPLLRSLNLLREMSSNSRLSEVLSDVYQRVEDGASLAEAMDRHRFVFRSMAINIVRAGGEGGFLEDALERVALFTEQEEDLKGRALGAVAYPIFLAVVGTAVLVGLLLFVVPQCEVMFGVMREKGELPVMTDWLLATSSVVRQWGHWLVLSLVVLFFFFRQQLMSEENQLRLDYLRLRLPLAGKIYESLAVARFCRILGTLLKNGVPLLKSLDISRQSAGNRVLSQAVADASINVTAGQSLAKPLAQSGHFPRESVEMIAVAEESNTLEKVLIDIADSLERRTYRRLDLLVRLLEPLMLLVMAGLILTMVLALLLPILKMGSMV
ncbi:MAG: type II secretion system F family protein [Planctomycetota bacterium]|nr:type II secretion system F family protein [Planctomycetota bacterium]